MRKVILLMFIVVVAGSLISCGGTAVQRVNENTITDLSGRWNDTDSHLVSEEMVKEALTYPWLTNFMKASGKNPTVIVGTIVNKTDEHIAIDVFQGDIERDLTNSGQVTFVSNKDQRQEVRDERTDQQDYASDATKKAFKQEIGADYMMQGIISSVTDQKEGTKAVYYQVDMTLTDMATNTKVWLGQKKIKKIIEKSGMGF